MPKYASAASTASSLTASFGGAITFTRTVKGTFDPVTQADTGSSTLTFSMTAVAIAPGRSAEYRIGSLVGRKLIELHCAPNLSTTPEPGDFATWAGNGWRVIWANALDPAGDGAPYVLVYAER